MPLVPAKCTQCGANLQVNSENECSICSACGTPFITEKAIINYNTTVNNTINNTYNVDSKTIVSGNNEVHIHNDELNRLFLIEGGELTEYKGNRSEITIPEGVIGIGKNFSENKNSKDIEKVTLPASLKYINGHLHYCKTVTFNENCSDINIAPGALGGYIQVIENLPLTIQNFNGNIFSTLRFPLITCKYSEQEFINAYGKESLYYDVRLNHWWGVNETQVTAKQRLLICFEFEKFVTTPDGFKIAKGKNDAIIYDYNAYSDYKKSEIKMPSYCEGVPITLFSASLLCNLSGKSNNIYLPEKTKEILSYDFLRLYALEGHTIFAPSCIKRIGRNGIMADYVKFENDYCEVEYIDDYGVYANSKNEIYAPNLKFLGKTGEYKSPEKDGMKIVSATFTKLTVEELQVEKARKQAEKKRQAEKYESEKEPLALVGLYKKELSVYAEKNNVKKLLATVKKGDNVTVKVHPSEIVYISDGEKQEVLPKGTKICYIGGFFSYWGIKCK